MGRRTKARECALQMLYLLDLTGATAESVIPSFWRLRSTTDETRARAEGLAVGAWRERSRIDEAISRAATHWRLERLAVVDRNILRLGVYELMREPDTPAAVIIDEAVEIAKRFGEADSPSFVNGVLDAVRRAVRGGAADEAPAGIASKTR
jgi:transcription antitermination protein NusB